MTTYVQDPITGKFVEKQAFLAAGHSAAVHTLKPFVSPIDQTVISDPAQLRAHNIKHGVTDRRDYGESWFERKRGELESKRQSQDKQSKQERINTLTHLTRHVRT